MARGHAAMLSKKGAKTLTNGTNGVPLTSGFVALSILASPLARKRPNPEHGGPCHLCTARCCKYFALEIDKPTTFEEYDQIRWYLMHEGIAVWVQDGDWYLEVRTVCRHLQADNSCGVYEKRPQICRDYGKPGEEHCEFFTDHLKYDLFWDNDETFEEWVEEQREKRRRQNVRRKERNALAAQR